MAVTVVSSLNARPGDALAAFLAGDVDAFSGGLTERVQAKRHGAVELVIGPDVSVPVINGIVASRKFATEHPREMQALLDLFFDTVRFMENDVRGHSKYVRDYLRGKASVDYSAEEYAIAWTFSHFARDRNQAIGDFLDVHSIYYWKPIWDATAAFLIAAHEIPTPIPYEAFWGDTALRPSVH